MGRKGVQYGEIPYHIYEEKQEVTNPDEEDNYHGYARDMLADRSIDAPFLASDEHRRPDSESKLNLRYNGTRGAVERPDHADLFIGHMEDDPRGSVNDPNFTKMRAQITPRVEPIKHHMGDNSVGQHAESVWTAVNLRDSRKRVDAAVKKNTKVFLDNRQNDVQTGGHSLIDTEKWLKTSSDIRRMNLTDAPDVPDKHKFVSSETAQKGGQAATYDAPWRNSIFAPMQVEKYGKANGTGTIDHNRGGASKMVEHSTTFKPQHVTASANKKVLAASMAAAIKYRQAATSAAPSAEFHKSAANFVTGGKLIGSADHSGQNKHTLATGDFGGQYNGSNATAALQSGDLIRTGHQTLQQLEEDQAKTNMYVTGTRQAADISAKHTLEDTKYGTENILLNNQRRYDANPEMVIKHTIANSTNNDYITNLGNIITNGLKPGSNPEKVIRHAIAGASNNAHLTDRSAGSSRTAHMTANPENALRLGATTSDYGESQKQSNKGGLIEDSDRAAILRKTSGMTDMSSHLINTIIISRGLAEGRKDIANQVIIDGDRQTEHGPVNRRSGLVQAGDTIKTASQTVASATNSHVSGLTTHNYRAKKMEISNRVQNTDAEKGTWRDVADQANASSKVHGEWRSATQADTLHDNEFGRGAAVGGSSMVVGPKNLKPNNISMEFVHDEF